MIKELFPTEKVSGGRRAGEQARRTVGEADAADGDDGLALGADAAVVLEQSEQLLGAHGLTREQTPLLPLGHSAGRQPEVAALSLGVALEWHGRVESSEVSEPSPEDVSGHEVGLVEHEHQPLPRRALHHLLDGSRPSALGVPRVEYVQHLVCTCDYLAQFSQEGSPGVLPQPGLLEVSRLLLIDFLLGVDSRGAERVLRPLVGVHGDILVAPGPPSPRLLESPLPLPQPDLLHPRLRSP